MADNKDTTDEKEDAKEKGRKRKKGGHVIKASFRDFRESIFLIGRHKKRTEKNKVRRTKTTDQQEINKHHEINKTTTNTKESTSRDQHQEINTKGSTSRHQHQEINRVIESKSFVE